SAGRQGVVRQGRLQADPRGPPLLAQSGPENSDRDRVHAAALSRFMRKFVLLVIAVASFAMLASSERGAAENQFGDANAQPAPFNPQMAAMMSMLIQPRHAKLGLAGATDNWPLAGYMLKELRQGFVITARAVPRWKGLPVPDLFDAAV